MTSQGWQPATLREGTDAPSTNNLSSCNILDFTYQPKSVRRTRMRVTAKMAAKRKLSMTDSDFEAERTRRKHSGEHAAGERIVGGLSKASITTTEGEARPTQGRCTADLTELQVAILQQMLTEDIGLSLHATSDSSTLSNVNCIRHSSARYMRVGAGSRQASRPASRNRRRRASGPD